MKRNGFCSTSVSITGIDFGRENASEGPEKEELGLLCSRLTSVKEGLGER